MIYVVGALLIVFLSLVFVRPSQYVLDLEAALEAEYEQQNTKK